MPRPRTSKIWMLPADQFANLVKKAKKPKDVLSYFGLENIGGNSRTMWSRIREQGLSTAHFVTAEEWRASRLWTTSAVPLSEVMVENSTYSRQTLKARLIREGVLKEECAICGLPPMWNGKRLVLRLDHENGVRNDNRERNLRLLCPNCDSQLDTFCGRLNKRNATKKCVKCGGKRKMRRGAERKCSTCANTELEKARWPTPDKLVRMCRSEGNSAVGRRLGVSETAVRKRLKKVLADRLTVGQGALNT